MRHTNQIKSMPAAQFADGLMHLIKMAKKNGMKQYQVAARLGIKANSLSRYLPSENRKEPPKEPSERVLMLAETLHKEFLSKEDDLSPDMRRRLDKWLKKTGWTERKFIEECLDANGDATCATILNDAKMAERVGNSAHGGGSAQSAQGGGTTGGKPPRGAG